MKIKTNHNSPLVSILIPAYNAEHWIEDTINSALNQTWENKEIIIVDDGSTDNTLSIANSFNSNKIIILNQDNLGGCAARNLAYSKCKGEYIQWLDADDILHPQKIAKQMDTYLQLKDTRVILSSAWGHFYYRTAKAKFRKTALWADISPYEWLLHKMNNGIFMPPMTWLVSREITEAAGPWNTSLKRDQDGEYFCRVLKASKRVKFVGEAISFYRRSGQHSVSSYVSTSSSKLESQLLSIKLHIDYLLSFNDNKRSRDSCLIYIQKYMFDFFPERPDIVKDMQLLASRLGGQLKTPKVSRKYWVIHKLFGWKASKYLMLRIQMMVNIVHQYWDWTLYKITPREKPTNLVSH